MIPVAEALERILAALAPVAAETVSLAEADGRVLAAAPAARLSQPPVAVSAMDGYAVRSADLAAVPATLDVIASAPAGGATPPPVGPGQAVRIFTGGPVPAGADAVVMQEDTDGGAERVTVHLAVPPGHHVRPAGLDFAAGATPLAAGTRLTPRAIALAAAMNHPWLRVRRRPVVAILATGDEVVLPGEPLGPHQITNSNGLALAAVVRAAGGQPRQLGIAPDDPDALAELVAAARGADLLVTSGGVSVGAHDLVRDLPDQTVDFWRIAMRPGKPLMFGRVGDTPILGLPGNPVSTLVCALLFLRPALDAMLGRPAGPVATRLLPCAADLPANGARQDHLRARLVAGADGPAVAPLDRQDSAMLAALAGADVLVVRPPQAPPTPAGTPVPVIELDRHGL